MPKKALLNTVLLPGIFVLVAALFITLIVVMEMKLSKKAEVSTRIMSSDAYSGDMRVKANNKLEQPTRPSPQPRESEVETGLAAQPK